MRGITIFHSGGQLVVDSKEVAEMVEKEHSNLMRDIRGYIEILNNPNSNLNPANFFIESSYVDKQKQSRPCFLLTRKGCDMVANKMTGEKGVLFTATYVTKFEEMEKSLTQSKPQCIEDVLIQSLHEMKNMRLQVQAAREETAAVKEEVSNIREVITINPKEDWRKDTNSIIAKVCKKLNDYKLPKDEIYRALEQRANCKLKIRLENMRGRVLKEGMARSKADALNYLDVISEDNKLKEIYIAIVKEMAIKQGVSIS